MKTLIPISILIFSFLSVYTARAEDLNFAHYHSQSDIKKYLQQESKSHPELVSFHNLGKSLQGREIDYIIISRGDSSRKPTLYFNGTHHGDEWSATEGILGLADKLISHANDPSISPILDKYSVYIQPLVNPDGHLAKTREDSLGRDPNRDYSSPDRPEGQSFRVPEILLVKKLVDAIHPRAAAAYHSGIQEVLWSWCNTDQATPSNSVLAAIGKLSATAMGMDRYLQSYDDYQSDGEFIDYVYMKFGTLALTFEVSDEKTPQDNELAAIVDRSVSGALAMIQGIEEVDEGRLPLELYLGQEPSFGHLGRSPWPGLRLE